MISSLTKIGFFTLALSLAGPAYAAHEQQCIPFSQYDLRLGAVNWVKTNKVDNVKRFMKEVPPRIKGDKITIYGRSGSLDILVVVSYKGCVTGAQRFSPFVFKAKWPWVALGK